MTTKSITAGNRAGGGKALSILLGAWFALAATLAAEAETYYKVGRDVIGESSFAGNVDSTNGWSTTQGATSTTTVSDWGNSDFIVDGGKLLRLPATDTQEVQFQGGSLTLESGGELGLKRNSTGGARTVVIADLRIADAGTIGMSNGKTTFTLQGKISLDSRATLTIGNFANEDPSRKLWMESTFEGDDLTTFLITGGRQL